MKPYDIFIIALQDMQNDGLNISVLSEYVIKHTGIYSIDSIVFYHYIPKRFR